MISDTFLSMSAPIQRALPDWLSQRAAPQGQIRERLEAKPDDAGRHPAAPDTGHPAGDRGGLVCRTPGSRACRPEEETALELLLERGVVVHPGGFFGFSGQGWLVVSLLAPEGEFRGRGRIAAHSSGNLRATS